MVSSNNYVPSQSWTQNITDSRLISSNNYVPLQPWTQNITYTSYSRLVSSNNYVPSQSWTQNITYSRLVNSNNYVPSQSRTQNITYGRLMRRNRSFTVLDTNRLKSQPQPPYLITTMYVRTVCDSIANPSTMTRETDAKVSNYKPMICPLHWQKTTLLRRTS